MKTWIAAIAVLGLTTIGNAADAQTEPVTVARNHITHIAAADAASLQADYASDSTVWWVGGPLDGTYGDAPSIKALWAKFATAQGAVTASVTGVSVAANPLGQTVVADVVYTGKNGPIKVRQIILMRKEHIVDEIWQIAPNGVVTP